MPVRPRCLVLTGPTAVGKTGILDRIAAGMDRPVEVISADAYQVYRGLDIGTAKPDGALLARIPHHLINIRTISESFNVGDFVHAAESLIKDILQRGSVPIVCGGTIYYIKHLIGGLPEAPPADLGIRSTLQIRFNELGPDWLSAEVARVDPESAARIHPNDHYRLMRALEVWLTSGRKLSAFETGSSRAESPYLVIALARTRSELVARIHERVHAMFLTGLPDEVAALLDAGYKGNEPGMQAIGYQEFLESGRLRQDLQNVENEVAIHTRQYAKRQMTFLRGIGVTEWVEASDEGAACRAILSRIHGAID